MKLKRLLSVLLCVAMIMGLTVTTSFAETAEERVLSINASDDSGLNIKKSITDNADGSYDLTMEAYATGEVTVTTKSVPMDIVLVLDQSGSMAYNFNGNDTNNDASRRQYAMKQAVNNFINTVNEKYDADKADHRVAIVTFDSNASTLQGWTFANNDGKATLQNKISGLPDEPRGATNVAAGMKETETLMGSGYNYTGSNTNRQKVVVVFTDGVPTTSTEFNTTVATNAITSAKALKDAGVTVYSVGIFNGANPDELYGTRLESTCIWVDSRNCSGNIGSQWGRAFTTFIGSFLLGDVYEWDVHAGNRFLNYISSNFADASEIGIKSTKADFPSYHMNGWSITKNFERVEDSYYLVANDSAGLEGIFQQIADETISAAIDADATTVMADTLSSYFDFKLGEDGKLAKFTAAKVPCTGENTWGTPTDITNSVTVAQEGKDIKVSGFDYNENIVAKAADNWQGNKLVVTFTIVPDDDAEWQTGTHYYPTNNTTDSKAGIYTADGTELLVLNESPNAPMTAATVTYQVSGAAPAISSALPEACVYLVGANVAVASGLTTTETTKDGKTGTWSFNGWDKTDDFAMTAENVVITGTWSFNYTEKTDVSMSKVWNDDDNRDGVRPDSISVQLLDSSNNAIGDAVTVTANDNWAHTWNVLKYNADGNEIAYHVVETSADRNYSASADGMTITNTHEVKTIDELTMTKVWADDDNRDGVRPDSIDVQLLANGEPCGDVVTVEANADGAWVYTWTDLYVNENGEPITYTVEEVNVDENYTASYSTDTLTVTNTHESAVTSKTVTKVWNDADNQDGIRPESVTVNLMNGEEIVARAVLNADNKWSYTWNDLYVNENGQAINYTVEEVDVAEGYESSVDGMVVTNTHEPEVVTIPVAKDWVGDTEAARPESITVNLLVDGEVVKTIKLTADKQWTGAFENVPVYANGEAIKYDVKEVAVDGYTAAYNVTENGVAIVNTLIPVDPEPTPVNPDPTPAPVPNTGDSSNMVLYIVLAVMALAGIAVVVLAPAKKRG